MMGYKTRKGIIAEESVSGTILTYGYIRDCLDYETSEELQKALKEEFPDVPDDDIETFADDFYKCDWNLYIFIPDPDEYDFVKNQLKMLEWILYQAD